MCPFIRGRHSLPLPPCGSEGSEKHSPSYGGSILRSYSLCPPCTGMNRRGVLRHSQYSRCPLEGEYSATPNTPQSPPPWRSPVDNPDEALVHLDETAIDEPPDGCPDRLPLVGLPLCAGLPHGPLHEGVVKHDLPHPRLRPPGSAWVRNAVVGDVLMQGFHEPAAVAGQPRLPTARGRVARVYDARRDGLAVVGVEPQLDHFEVVCDAETGRAVPLLLDCGCARAVVVGNAYLGIGCALEDRRPARASGLVLAGVVDD